jgi:hypothetical protein
MNPEVPKDTPSESPLTELEQRLLKQAQERFPDKSEEEQSRIADEWVYQFLADAKEKDREWGREYSRLRAENPNLDEDALMDMVDNIVYPEYSED